MPSFSSYATSQWHAATTNSDIVTGQVTSNIGTTVDKIKTWIVSMVHLMPEHIKKIKTSIVSMGHHALKPLTDSIIPLLHQHPYAALVISTLISFAGAILIPPILLCAVCTPVLACLGFCAEGIAGGSIAAGIQSAHYGAAVPAGGLFATMQSIGATMSVSILTALSSWVLIVLWLIFCAVLIYVVFGILLH